VIYKFGHTLSGHDSLEIWLYEGWSEVEERDGGFFHEGRPVTREFGKMGKSLKNSVTPDDMYRDYGADTLRLYEMSTGPLDQSRPWDTKAVVGVFRLLQRIWRNVVDEDTGELVVGEGPPDEATERLLHKTIAAVRDDMDGLRFNTAIARITELNNHLTATFPDGGAPRSVVEALVLLLAPLAPHVAEELWSRLGHDRSLAWADFPVADPALLVEDTVEVVVQVNGKVRAKLELAAGLDADDLEAAVRSDDRVAQLLDGATIRKVVAVPGKLVNFVLG
jgi:leucyl-tRNA synthetase